VPISTPGFRSAPYLTATLCITRDPETGVRNMGTYRAALKKTDRLGVRMASRIGGAGGYLHCRSTRAGSADAMRDRDRLRSGVIYTGPQKFATNVDEMTVAAERRARPSE